MGTYVDVCIVCGVRLIVCRMYSHVYILLCVCFYSIETNGIGTNAAAIVRLVRNCIVHIFLCASFNNPTKIRQSHWHKHTCIIHLHVANAITQTQTHTQTHSDFTVREVRAIHAMSFCTSANIVHIHDFLASAHTHNRRLCVVVGVDDGHTQIQTHTHHRKSDAKLVSRWGTLRTVVKLMISIFHNERHTAYTHQHLADDPPTTRNRNRHTHTHPLES